jgi:hypothetical protein
MSPLIAKVSYTNLNSSFYFADVFFHVNPECREDRELCQWIDEMSPRNFSLLSRRRYRKRFGNDNFIKKTNLLAQFPMLTLSSYRKYALDLSNLLSPIDRRRSKKQMKTFTDDHFRLAVICRYFLMLILDVEFINP